MSRVAKYRRQVSEDPDIDNLLSTLSPEEMEQLQKELDAGDPDAGVSAGLRRDQTERASSQREAERESKRLAQSQPSPESGKSSEKAKEEKKMEENAKEVRTPDPSSTKKLEDAKDTKTQGKKDTDKPKDERVSKMRERFRQEKNSSALDKEKLERTPPKKLVEEKSTKQTGKEKAEKVNTEEKKEKKVLEKIEKEAVAEVQAENKLDKKIISDKSSEKKSESTQANKKIPQEKQSTEKDKLESAQANKKIPPEKQSTTQDKSETIEPLKAENGAKNQAEENKEDESMSIFDELIEKVKNNEAGMTELNLNNSDCITIETLMSFTEALEFNTVVKTFSLANTRADDHIALAISAMLKSNKTIISINLDSNHITGKGILAIFRALQHNDTLTELRFHNQRHICGGKTEMEIAKMLKENTTILKLGYHFELAGPRMTVTNLLSRNMDKQRQRRMAEQKALKDAENKKNCLEVPKVIPPPKNPPKSLSKPVTNSSQKGIPKKGGVPIPPPPPPPMAPLAPPLFNENIRNSLSPASQRRIVEKTGPAEKNSRDQLLESIRSSNMKQLKKVEVPKWLK
ncbi:leiomodin-1 [Mixophyes fleayi]|uniref:leiomodin-1 n=1 Tax=Mixophyes fleayi TaxID=3061075 RepID=UPI003F4E1FF1